MSDDDEFEGSESDTWFPPPPDDDEYDDPNPRAVVQVESPPASHVRHRSVRQQHEDRLGDLVRQTIDHAGITGMLGALLDEMNKKPVEVTKECSTCGHAVAPFYRTCPRCEGNRNRRSVERIAELVREMKQIAMDGDQNPGRERELAKQLSELGHPDIDGLERWCSAARERAERAGAGSKKARW